jgi:hypothetical protein
MIFSSVRPFLATIQVVVNMPKSTRSMILLSSKEPGPQSASCGFSEDAISPS